MRTFRLLRRPPRNDGKGERGQGKRTLSHFPFTFFPPPRARGGYIFLISVLVIGAIASTTAMSLLLLGLASELTGLSVTQSAQAYELASTCAERAIRSLRLDPAYAGNDTLSLTGGTCSIGNIGGAGNESRTICVSGFNADITRRLEIRLTRLYPSVKPAAWREVDAFTLCP